MIRRLTYPIRNWYRLWKINRISVGKIESIKFYKMIRFLLGNKTRYDDFFKSQIGNVTMFFQDYPYTPQQCLGSRRWVVFKIIAKHRIKTIIANW